MHVFSAVPVTLLVIWNRIKIHVLVEGCVSLVTGAGPCCIVRPFIRLVFHAFHPLYFLIVGYIIIRHFILTYHIHILVSVEHSADVLE